MHISTNRGIIIVSDTEAFMKKFSLVILIIIAVLISSCSLRKIEDADTMTSALTQTETTQTAITAEITSVETKVEEEVLPIGIYNMTYCSFGTREVYELQTDFKDDQSLGRDLCVFAVFPSQEKELSGQYFKYIWEDAIKANPEAEKMKIGYFFEYMTPEGKYAETILRPSDISEDFWDYIEVYIYDDVNQDVTAWHSHLLDNQITDETLVTSFKITAGAKIADVSEMRLTAFLYSPDKADSIDMSYIARHGYTVNISSDRT